jgi:hypothetical protein
MEIEVEDDDEDDWWNATAVFADIANSPNKHPLDKSITITSTIERMASAVFLTLTLPSWHRSSA